MGYQKGKSRIVEIDNNKNLKQEVDNLSAQLAQTEWEVKRKRELEDLSPTVLAAIEGGEGTSFNLLSIPQDGSVTPKKTTFARAGKNKFDGTYINASLSGSDGVLTENADARSAVVQLEKGKTYTASRGTGGNHFRIGTFAGTPNFGDTPLRLVGNAASATVCTFTLTGDEDHIVIYVKTPSGTDMPTYVQVEEGPVATPYSEPKVIIDLEDESVEFSKITGLNSHALLCGQSTGFNVDLSNKKIITLASTGFVRIGSKEYRLKNGEWDYSHITSQTVFISFDTSTSDILFFDLAGLRISQNYLYPIIGVIRQNDNTAWVNGVYSINGKAVKPYTGETVGDVKPPSPDFIITDISTESYKTTQPYEELTSDMTYQELYSKYDALMSTYPNYITRTQVGSSAENDPIYRYDFIPPNPEPTGNGVHPKIYYQTALHGYEKMAALSGYLFFKDMCENWKTDSVLKTLRWNVHFIVVPVVNPSGFNLNQRKSASGVDLNRNFLVGWTENLDTESTYYPGTAPLSEPETQAVNSIIENEPNLIYAVDHHNSQAFQGPGGWDSYYYWVATNKPNTKKFLTGLAQQMSAHGLMTNSNLIEKSTSYGRVVKPSGGTFTSTAEQHVLATTLETSQMILNDAEFTQKFNIDSVGNFFISVLRNYEQIKSDAM